MFGMLIFNIQKWMYTPGDNFTMRYQNLLYASRANSFLQSNNKKMEQVSCSK